MTSVIAANLQTKRGAQRGFTVVELAIVIVVIAILVAIISISYRGAIEHAHDAAVQNDLQSFATALNSDALWNDVGVNKWNGVHTATALASLGWKISKDAYATSPGVNIAFCHNRSYDAIPAYPWATAANVHSDWLLFAQSTSGSYFYVSNKQRTPTMYTGGTPIAKADGREVCGIGIDELGAAGFSGAYHGYNVNDTTTGPWREWTGVTN